MKNYQIQLISFLGLALLVVGTLLWRQHAITADLQSKLITSAQTQSRLEAELVVQEKRSHELDQLIIENQKRTRELEEKLASAHRDLAQPTIEAQTSRLAQPATAVPAKDWLATAKDPDTIKAQTARIRRQLEFRYGDLVQKYNLTPQQAEQFMQLLVDKRLASTDATIATLDQNSNAPSDPAAVANLVTGAIDESNNQLRALLGDTNYSDYRKQELTLGQSSTIMRLSDALNESQPLNNAQIDQLQQLLDRSNTGHITPKTIADARSSGFLSPVQLQALQDLYQLQQAAQQRRRSLQTTTGK